MAIFKKNLPAADATGGAGEKAVAPVATQPASGEPGTPAAPVVPAPPVTSFGGNPTGRKLTKFKHPPGTPEGIEERRKDDADRKAAARAVAAKMVEPPPLPSAGPGVAGQPAAPGSPLFPGPGPGLVAVEAPPVLWQPEMLHTIIEKLLAAAEENRVGNFVAKCEQAGLLPKLIKEIEADASFPASAKALLKDSLPRLACKWLNRFGISSEFRDELACVTAILLIVKHDKSTSARLDELIALKKIASKVQEAVAVTLPAMAA